MLQWRKNRIVNFGKSVKTTSETLICFLVQLHTCVLTIELQEKVARLNYNGFVNVRVRIEYVCMSIGLNWSICRSIVKPTSTQSSYNPVDGKNEIVAVEARISENSEIFSRGTDTSKEVLSTFSQKIMFDDIRMSTLE